MERRSHAQFQARAFGVRNLQGVPKVQMKSLSAPSFLGTPVATVSVTVRIYYCGHKYVWLSRELPFLNFLSHLESHQSTCGILEIMCYDPAVKSSCLCVHFLVHAPGRSPQLISSCDVFSKTFTSLQIHCCIALCNITLNIKTFLHCFFRQKHAFDIVSVRYVSWNKMKTSFW